MLPESFQFFSPPPLSSIHQATSASFCLYLRLLLNFFSYNPWLKSELAYLVKFHCTHPAYEILNFLSGPTAPLCSQREQGLCRFTTSTSGEPSPPIYFSAGAAHEFSTRKFPHQTPQSVTTEPRRWVVKVKWCWAIPDSYPPGPLTVCRSSPWGISVPNLLKTAQICWQPHWRWPMPSSWQGRGEVPRNPSSLAGDSGAGITSFLHKDFLFSFLLSPF